MQNLINHSRRNFVRRQKERRVIQFSFNSPEWIAKMQEGYVLWPKQDNRKADRRASDRRSAERRAEMRASKRGRQKRSDFYREATDDILEYNEKQFIMTLFNEDL